MQLSLVRFDCTVNAGTKQACEEEAFEGDLPALSYYSVRATRRQHYYTTYYFFFFCTTNISHIILMVDANFTHRVYERM